MNSDPNSVLSQNWVGCIVRTPKAKAMHALPQGSVHAARWAPCHGALGTVSWPPSYCVIACLLSCRRAHTRAIALCRSPPVAIQNLYRDVEAHAARTAHLVARAQRNVTTHTSALLRLIAACLIALCHDTKICIATHPRGRAACARCRSPLRAGRPCRSALLAVLQLCCAPPACTRSIVSRPGARPALLCHDTICCIVTQHQKWAVAHPNSTALFFFTHFFSFVLLTARSNFFFFSYLQ